jgi:hypothetical protein
MLAFLHTSQRHVSTFDDLVRDVDPSLLLRHEVREDLLEAARHANAITLGVRSSTAEAVQSLARAGARVIVCTCSTLGGVAESVTVPEAVSVLRIDRPMAERAVTSGRRILVVAALASTLSPTVTLLRESAAEQKRAIQLVEVWCEGAWPHFEAGNLSAYAARIAEVIEREALPGDTVVLAQASMAPAAHGLAHLDMTVLSSPKLGVEAAVSRYRALGEVCPPVSRVEPPAPATSSYDEARKTR